MLSVTKSLRVWRETAFAAKQKETHKTVVSAIHTQERGDIRWNVYVCCLENEQHATTVLFVMKRENATHTRAQHVEGIEGHDMRCQPCLWMPAPAVYLSAMPLLKAATSRNRQRPVLLLMLSCSWENGWRYSCLPKSPRELPRLPVLPGFFSFFPPPSMPRLSLPSRTPAVQPAQSCLEWWSVPAPFGAVYNKDMNNMSQQNTPAGSYQHTGMVSHMSQTEKIGLLETQEAEKVWVKVVSAMLHMSLISRHVMPCPCMPLTWGVVTSSVG